MLRVKLQRSRLLAALVAIPHVGAAAILVPLDLPLIATGIVLAVILASLILSTCRYAGLVLRCSIIGLEVRDRTAGAFQTRDGNWHEARILGTSYVTPTLTVVNLQSFGATRTRHVLIVADNLSPEDFRKLRVVLRWRRGPDPDPAWTTECS